MTLGEWKMLGLITFLDPPRPDTKKTIEDARYRCSSSCYYSSEFNNLVRMYMWVLTDLMECW